MVSESQKRGIDTSQQDADVLMETPVVSLFDREYYCGDGEELPLGWWYVVCPNCWTITLGHKHEKDTHLHLPPHAYHHEHPTLATSGGISLTGTCNGLLIFREGIYEAIDRAQQCAGLPGRLRLE
jgi:hypothetical protein